MSRGRTGIIKALKEVFREVKFFGDAEIATLKKELEAHKLQLEQLKAARAERARREEALTLLEMRRAVENLQKMNGFLVDQDQKLEAAAEELAQRARQQQEQDLQARASSLMKGINVQEMLMAEEAELEQRLQQLRTELKGLGDPVQPPPPPAGGSTGGSGVGVGKSSGSSGSSLGGKQR